MRLCAVESGNEQFLYLEISMGITYLVIFLGFAFVAGLSARQLMPGPNPAGIAGTILIGMVGGLFGGLVGSFVAGVPATAFDGRSLLLAISGTMFALFAYRAFALRWPDQPGARPESVRDALTHAFLSTWK